MMQTISPRLVSIPAGGERRPGMTMHLLQVLAAMIDRLVSRCSTQIAPPPEWFKYPPF
jgi:hypothetical protein